MKQPPPLLSDDAVTIRLDGKHTSTLRLPLADTEAIYVGGKCVHDREATYLEVSGYVIVVPDGKGGIKAIVSPWGTPHIYGVRGQARRDLMMMLPKHPTAILRKLSGFVSLSKT